MSRYNEDTLRQQTMADYLRDQLQWESVYAFNDETFGATGLLGRESDRDVVLTRYLRAALEKLNPGLPAVAYTDAIRQLTETTATQSLVATNRDKSRFTKTACRCRFATPRANSKNVVCVCSISRTPPRIIFCACANCGCAVISIVAAPTSWVSSTACR